jgi:hypothetical protein
VRREHKFTMMFSEEEFQRLQALARARGLSLSTFLRLPLYEPSSSTAEIERSNVRAIRKR